MRLELLYLFVCTYIPAPVLLHKHRYPPPHSLSAAVWVGYQARPDLMHHRYH